MTTAPAPTTSAARVQGATSSSTSAPGIASSAGGAAPSASSGSTASSGTAATSWNSSTAKLARPPSVWASFFSASVCITIAVDDSDRMMPTATAWFHGSPEQPRDPGEQREREPDLQPAEADQPVPELPQHPRLHLEPDEEQHQDDAVLGIFLHVRGLAADQPERRPDRHPRRQVAEHRAEPEPLADRHRDHRRGEVDGQLQKDRFQALLRRSPTAR